MEKILLVEYNKALSKLIGKKINQNTEFEVDIALYNAKNSGRNRVEISQ